MTKLRIILPLALACLIILSLATPVRAGYTVRPEGNALRVTWVMNAVQNLTAWPISATVFPAGLSTSLSGADLAQFSAALQTAVQQKNSVLTVSDASLQLSSNSPNASCSGCFQWLNATASFLVHDPVPQNTGVAQYDMSWIPIRIDQDLTAGGVGYNLLGQDYLVKAIVPFIGFVPSSDRSLTMLVNTEPITKIGYQPVVAALTFFDASPVTSQLKDWSHSFDLKQQTQTWTSPNTGGFNFTARENIVSESAHLVYVAGVRLGVQVSTSMNANVRGNTLFIDFSNGFYDQLALAIIVASIVILVITMVFDRRLTRSYAQKRKGRKR